MTLGVICFFILEKKCKFSHCGYFPSPLNHEGLVQNVYFSLFLAFLQTKISIEYLSFFVPPTIIITKMFLYYLPRNKIFAPVFKFLPTKNLERFVSCEPKDYKWKGPLKKLLCMPCASKKTK
jgi:hypothetical protein